MHSNPIHLQLLLHALAHHPHLIESFSQGEFVAATARQNDKRPAFIQATVPDAWVKNLKGDPEQQDVYLMVKIGREAWEELSNPKQVVVPSLVDASGNPIVSANEPARTD